MTGEKALCNLCGEPMPEGEEMFMYHGYSCDCPKPPKRHPVIGVDPAHPEGDKTVHTIVSVPEKWLIWSIEHNAWWAPAERGYVENRDEAGVYSYERACEIVRNANRDLQRPNEAMIKIEIELGPFDMCIDPERCKQRGDSCTGMCQLNTHHDEEE